MVRGTRKRVLRIAARDAESGARSPRRAVRGVESRTRSPRRAARRARTGNFATPNDHQPV